MQRGPHSQPGAGGRGRGQPGRLSLSESGTSRAACSPLCPSSGPFFTHTHTRPAAAQATAPRLPRRPAQAEHHCARLHRAPAHPQAADPGADRQSAGAGGGTARTPCCACRRKQALRCRPYSHPPTAAAACLRLLACSPRRRCATHGASGCGACGLIPTGCTTSRHARWDACVMLPARPPAWLPPALSPASLQLMPLPTQGALPSTDMSNARY